MRAVITGVTGQDGAYLAKLLLEKNYKVYGAYRRTSTPNFHRMQELNILDHENLKLVECDLTDLGSCIRLLDQAKPKEVYNLAAQSFVGASFNSPATTTLINTMGPLNLLEAIRTLDRKIKFYQASTSEMFGKVQTVPQNEHTPFYPRSPYGVSKLYGHWITVNYRESYDIHANSGILFNHESPLRGLEFVTRKITDGLARIHNRQQQVLKLGFLDVKRDWGHAEDYVHAMWLMLQQSQPRDFVVSTGTQYSVRQFCEASARALDYDLIWEGSGVDEVGINAKSGKVVIRIDPEFYRPAEVNTLLGDSSEARKVLGWMPKHTFDSMVTSMVEADLRRTAK
jgi:GDPmannose 4,6-dehydratase